MTAPFLDALIQRVGPCIVVAHSQGGGYATAAARHIAAQVGIPPEHVLINCSHTHSGPYTDDFYSKALVASAQLPPQAAYGKTTAKSITWIYYIF